jgi:hypothetical protein
MRRYVMTNSEFVVLTLRDLPDARLRRRSP